MILIWYKITLKINFFISFWRNCTENTWVYERNWVAAIHFKLCEIVLNYAFNLVDVD